MDKLFEVMVKINGKMLPLEACEWVFYRKCGCPFGCMHAETADEQVAWKEMFYYARDRNRHRKQGVTAELMPFAQAKEEVFPKMRSDYECPHKEG